jgi:WD40 repeat protein
VQSERMLIAAVVLVVALTAACTRSAAPTRRPSTSSVGRGIADVHGRMLLTTGTRGTDLSLLSFPASRPQALRIPTSSNFFFSQAFFSADGTPYIMQLSPTTRVLALSADQPPRPVGPRLRACGESAQMIEHTMYVADCFQATVHLLDLDHPDAWTSLKGGIQGTAPRGSFAAFGAPFPGPVQQGASVSVSPDGTRLAFLLRGRDGLEVWERPIDGSSPPVRWLSLGRLPALREAGIDRPKLFSGIVWGPGGLSLGLAQVIGFQFGSSSLGAIVTRSDDGRVRTLALGNLAPGAMAWQPGGHVLAFIDQVGEGGFFQARYQELRTIDVRTGTVRQLAASYGVFNGAAAWSPDGRSIAWSHGPGLLQVLDPTGRALGTLDVEGTPGAWVG